MRNVMRHQQLRLMMSYRLGMLGNHRNPLEMSLNLPKETDPLSPSLSPAVEDACLLKWLFNKTYFKLNRA